MREIKFRAWDRDAKELVDVALLDVKRKQIIPKHGTDDEVVFIRKDNIELMQFTCLHDKTGNEIYEGDILNVDGLIVPVGWYGGAWTVEYFTIPTHSYLAHFDETDIEVIGNIYENPELLSTHI